MNLAAQRYVDQEGVLEADQESVLEPDQESVLEADQDSAIDSGMDQEGVLLTCPYRYTR